MTAFSLIARESQYLLTGLLFLAGMGELALCLYRHISRSEWKRRVSAAAAFLLALALCSFFLTAAQGRAYAACPWALIPLMAALAAVHAVLALRREIRRSREKLSLFSVKQALDNLNSGILFADGTGKAVLVNRVMARLAAVLIGSYPQMLDELEAALRAPDGKSGVERLGESPALLRFPDGHIWRFQTVSLNEPPLAGFTQTSAQDITELYETNAQLERDNAALRETIRKMQAMTKRLTDLIPKQEALKLKIRIHDEIGASLIALSALAAEGNRADTEAQLRILEHALIPFGSDRAVVPGTLQAAQRQAAERNVTLVFDGFVPPDGETERLIAAAALECVTNCIRHAGGSRVTVKISAQEGICTAVLTNDGKAPEAPIREGGGLSALRKAAESAGGEMYVSHYPRFALILHLPERRPEE